MIGVYVGMLQLDQTINCENDPNGIILLAGSQSHEYDELRRNGIFIKIMSNG